MFLWRVYGLWPLEFFCLSLGIQVLKAANQPWGLLVIQAVGPLKDFDIKTTFCGIRISGLKRVHLIVSCISFYMPLLARLFGKEKKKKKPKKTSLCCLVCAFKSLKEKSEQSLQRLIIREVSFGKWMTIFIRPKTWTERWVFLYLGSQGTASDDTEDPSFLWATFPPLPSPPPSVPSLQPYSSSLYPSNTKHMRDVSCFQERCFHGLPHQL